MVPRTLHVVPPSVLALTTSRVPSMMIVYRTDRRARSIASVHAISSETTCCHVKPASKLR
jgi:hypothetical protein